jgi:two-component system, chemotaxis family, CheB/CheR fusion protein
MPNDHAHIMDATNRHFDVRGNMAVPLPADRNPSVKDLLSRNGALALHNRQLTIALARQSAEAPTAMAHLTPRQQQVMALVLAGHPSKNIAADLNISQRTVENHRAAIMRRTGASSLPALVRLSLGIA